MILLISIDFMWHHWFCCLFSINPYWFYRFLLILFDFFWLCLFSTALICFQWCCLRSIDLSIFYYFYFEWFSLFSIDSVCYRFILRISTNPVCFPLSLFVCYWVCLSSIEFVCIPFIFFVLHWFHLFPLVFICFINFTSFIFVCTSLHLFVSK